MFFPFCFFTDAELQLLNIQMLESRSRAFADKTSANHLTVWVKYLKFCLYFSLIAFPATEQVISWFAQKIANGVKSAKTVASSISAVEKLHLILGFHIRGFRNYLLRLTMMGISRGCTFVSKQAQPITLELLSKIYHHVDLSSREDALFWLCCLLAFFLLFRKSNLVPDTLRGFNPAKQLKWQDLIYTGHNIIVGIRWSKTDQFGRQLKTYPLPVIPGSFLCPLNAMRIVLKLTGAEASDHVFTRGDGTSLTYKQFQSKLRRVLAAVGVNNPEAFSSHSFRRGGATFAYLCGVPTEIIKLLGNWKSDCYLKYIHLPLEARIAASELIKIKLMHARFNY